MSMSPLERRMKWRMFDRPCDNGRRHRIKDILEIRSGSLGVVYHVRWSGLPYTTWETEDSLMQLGVAYINDLIQRWLMRHT